MNRAFPALAFAMTAALIGCAHDKLVTPTDVPAALQVPGNQKLTRMLHGAGVQIYQCTPNAQNPPQYSWVFQAPAADLSDRSGKDLGRHYEGPTWEAYDGSKVVGELVARDNGPTPSAVPWLLLRAKSNAGKGIFGRTTSIQRLHTIGGQAPPSGCDASHAGQRTRVPYSADYYFYVARR
jgi:Protein of unknown function (DUF3455)